MPTGEHPTPRPSAEPRAHPSQRASAHRTSSTPAPRETRTRFIISQSAPPDHRHRLAEEGGRCGDTRVRLGRRLRHLCHCCKGVLGQGGATVEAGASSLPAGLRPARQATPPSNLPWSGPNFPPRSLRAYEAPSVLPASCEGPVAVWAIFGTVLGYEGVSNVDTSEVLRRHVFFG